MTDSWSQVPALVNNLPEPVLFKRELVTRIQEAYYELLKERGAVHVSQDVFAMVRRIGAELDRMGGYGEAFAAGKKLLKELLEEELVTAVGEQDGIPNQGLTVPDSEGDIRLSLDAPRAYDIDLDQLVGVLITQILNAADETEMVGTEAIVYAVQSTVAALQSWGKVEPQVSKVKAYGDTLARGGLDKGASIVAGAIREKNPYKGVKFERKKP